MNSCCCLRRSWKKRCSYVRVVGGVRGRGWMEECREAHQTKPTFHKDEFSPPRGLGWMVETPTFSSKKAGWRAREFRYCIQRFLNRGTIDNKDSEDESESVFSITQALTIRRNAFLFSHDTCTVILLCKELQFLQLLHPSSNYVSLKWRLWRGKTSTNCFLTVTCTLVC